MPVRYTVAPDSTGAPKISAPFKVTDADDKPIALKGKIHYTTRLLRTGYLYVYDEKRDRWEAYYITPDANFMRMEINKPMPQALVGRVPCESSGHAQVASMITISDPKNATHVWFGYSEVEWTPAVLKKHEAKAYREQHMQMLDVQVALGPGGKAHTQHIAKLGSAVAEFNLDPLKHKTDYFLFQNPIKYNPRKLQTHDVIRVADALRKDKGTILALHDPAGLMLELGNYTNFLLNEKLEYADQKDKDYSRKVAVSSRIAQLHDSIYLNAQGELVSNAEAIADSLKSLHQYANDRAGGGLYDDNDYEKISAPTAAEISRYQASQWKKYTTNSQTGKPRFDSTGVNNFMESHEKMMEEFYQSDIKPLAESYVAWFKSHRLKNSYTCNFCSINEKSGAAYTKSVIVLTSYTEGMRPCFKAYAEQLGKDKAEVDDILLRALVFNNDELAKQVQEAVAFDNRAVPWDPLFGSLTEVVKKIGEEAAKLPILLLRNMAGPMSIAFEKFVGGAGSFAFTAMGMHSEVGWQRMSFTGTKIEFRKFLARSILQANDVKMSKMQLHVVLEREIKLAKIHGENLNGQYTFKWVAMRKKGTAKLSTPGQLAKDAGESAAAKANAKLAQVSTVLTESTAPTIRGAKSLINGEVRINAITGLLQYWCLTKTIADYKKALLADQPEAVGRLTAGLLAVAGSTVEGLSNVLEGALHAEMPWAQGLSKTGLNWVRFFGKGLGFVGGAIMAVWDYMKRNEEKEKGNKLTANLFFASAGFGAAVSICLTFAPAITNGMVAAGMSRVAASTLLGWITIGLVIIFVGVAVWLDRVKDNAIQSWLENCVFGIHKEAYAGKPELEMQEYVKAIS